MKPVIKYQGGKRKELPLIKKMLPQQFNRVVEPFCGGAAVSFGLQTPAILNDINPMVINLYKVLQSTDYVHVLKHINIIKTYEHDALQEAFYAARNVINNPQDFTPLIQAVSYIIVRQLCFSGMERYNAKGEFNVPFGHYKKMSSNITLFTGSYPIIVGPGGSKGNPGQGSDGGNSSGLGYSSTGGGGGGGPGGPDANADGRPGGSGGGSDSPPSSNPGGAGNAGGYSPSEGNPGGAITTDNAGSGGGGAGGAGGNNSQHPIPAVSIGGVGGNGAPFTAYAASLFPTMPTPWKNAVGPTGLYGGGGGGGSQNAPSAGGTPPNGIQGTPPAGGPGGGGKGDSGPGDGSNGESNTGGGGGGGARGYGFNGTAYDGGSGIVIIRYLT